MISVSPNYCTVDRCIPHWWRLTMGVANKCCTMISPSPQVTKGSIIGYFPNEESEEFQTFRRTASTLADECGFFVNMRYRLLLVQDQAKLNNLNFNLLLCCMIVGKTDFGETSHGCHHQCTSVQCGGCLWHLLL